MAAPVKATAKAVQAHPAGTAGGVGGLITAWLISSGYLTQDQAAALVAAGGLLVTAISWINGHGGIAGLWNDLLHGSDFGDEG